MKKETYKEAIYCGDCGSKLVIHDTNRYNRFTGKIVKSKHCPNLNCEQGCEFDGHKFGLFSQTCKRCGYVIYDIY